MAFTIAYYKKNEPNKSLLRFLSLQSYTPSALPKIIYSLLAVLLISCIQNTSLFANEEASGFSIQSLETLMQNRVYLLNANFHYQFSKEAIEALEHGVPLLILVDIEILTPRWYWTDKTIAELEQGYLLLYHALSESYVVHNLNSGTQNNFLSLKRAISSLSHIKELPILDANLLNPDKDYYLRVRTHLDIESLPVPMRPLAYISSDWSLSSDWYEWPLQQ